jgi:hypothetical protein
VLSLHSWGAGDLPGGLAARGVCTKKPMAPDHRVRGGGWWFCCGSLKHLGPAGAERLGKVVGVPRSLTDHEARWALDQVHSGHMTQTQVALSLGKSLSLINALVNGRIYKHLHGTGRQRNTDEGIRYGLDETPERRAWRETKFWFGVDRSGGQDACWPYSTAPPGKYGLTGAGLAMTGSAAAHVVAFTLARGLPKAPDRGVVLRHLCDNKPCCNPAHLLPGTQSENVGDVIRAKREGRSGPQVVINPVAAPPGGWIIRGGDLDELDRDARISEFHARVDCSGGAYACWPWIGASRHQFGYGFMRFDGVSTVSAHRIAYAIEYGLKLSDMPRGMVIRHLCSDPAYRNNCNNPAHLAAGSQAENLADMVEHRTQIRGEEHHLGRRYPDELIKTLRERYWGPEGQQPTITELAEEQGIAVTVVSRWLNGKGRLDAGGPLGPAD